MLDDLKRLWYLPLVQRLRGWLVGHPRLAVFALVLWGVVASFTPAYQSLQQRGAWWLAVRGGSSPEQQDWKAFLQSRDEVARLSSQTKDAVAQAYAEAADARERQARDALTSAIAQLQQQQAEYQAQYPDARAALVEAEEALPSSAVARDLIADAWRRFRSHANDPNWYDQMDFTPDAAASPLACDNDIGFAYLFAQNRKLRSNILRCATAANLDDDSQTRLGLDNTDVDAIFFIHGRVIIASPLDLPEFLALLWRHKVTNALTSQTSLYFPSLTNGTTLSADLLGSGLKTAFREEALKTATASERIRVRQLYPLLEAYVQAANHLVEICKGAAIANCGY